MRKTEDNYVKHWVGNDLRTERVQYEVGRSPAWDLLVNGSISLVLNLVEGGNFAPGDSSIVISGARWLLLASSG